MRMVMGRGALSFGRQVPSVGEMQDVDLELPRLRTLARHAVPHIFEATLAPLALFYVTLWTVGIWGGLFAALGWSYAALARRAITGRRVPGILLLGSIALTMRTAVALSTGSVFVYFLQPSLGTIAVGTLFLLSVPAGRPLAQRLAADFCPLPDTFVDLPRVRSFFRRISLLWAFVNLANAGLTIWLLVSQPVATFLMARTLVSFTFTGTAIGVSTWWFRRSMRRHGIVLARAGATSGRVAVGES